MRSPKPPTPLQIRMPDDLKEHLRAQAAANRRSLNGELLFRLEQSREHDRRTPMVGPNT